MRQDYIPAVTTCVGGINEQDNRSREECADLRNMWRLEGKAQQRPGYVGVRSVNTFSTNTLTNPILVSENPDDTFLAAASGATLSLNNWPVGGRWYLGFDDVPATAIGSLWVPTATANSAATWADAEYWDSTAWRRLIVPESNPGTGRHLGSAGADQVVVFQGVPPQDWATKAITVGVTTYTKYWIRWTIRETALDASTSLENSNPAALRTSVISNSVRGLFAPRWPSTKHYLIVTRDDAGVADLYQPISGLAYNDSLSEGYAISAPSSKSEGLPATIAILPEFDEAYVAYNHRVTRHKAYPSSSDDITATVESRPEIVGPNAKYSTSYIAQLGEFPKASLITYFKGFLWAADIEGDPHGIRWSAPGFAYKVWPLISRETLAENDNSGNTAFYGFGENMLVWKNDSMWQMQYIGLNAFGLAEFKPQRIPSGVGCVSQASVVEIHGKVYWLAEDGVYSFDGVRVRPVFKEKIQSVFRRINPSRRSFATGVNWAPYNVYMLAVAVDGSNANNLVLVYDYDNKSWWLWDGIEAQFWLADEDSADNFTLYFGDASGRIYEMGKGFTDHGGTIESYVLTDELAVAPLGVTKTLRQVSVQANNLARSLTIEARATDEASGASAAKSYTDGNEVEYGSAIAASVYVPDRARTRRLGFREDGQHFQIKVSHTTKNTPWTLYAVGIGYEMKGRRR